MKVLDSIESHLNSIGLKTREASLILLVILVLTLVPPFIYRYILDKIRFDEASFMTQWESILGQGVILTLVVFELNHLTGIRKGKEKDTKFIRNHLVLPIRVLSESLAQNASTKHHRGMIYWGIIFRFFEQMKYQQLNSENEAMKFLKIHDENHELLIEMNGYFLKGADDAVQIKAITNFLESLQSRINAS